MRLRSQSVLTYYVDNQLEIENPGCQFKHPDPIVSPLCYFALDLEESRIFVLQLDFETTFPHGKTIAVAR